MIKNIKTIKTSNNTKNFNKTSTKSKKDIALYCLKKFSHTTKKLFLILNANLRMIEANTPFYETFHVSKKQINNKLIYDIGNGQWNIPKFKELLEKILPKKGSIDNFEVTHNFPEIGVKTMILNAMQLDKSHHILLAIEDITLKKVIEKKLANYTNDLKKSVTNKTKELKIRIDELSELNKVMIGRELKMIEMKKKIAELEGRNPLLNP